MMYLKVFRPGKSAIHPLLLNRLPLRGCLSGPVATTFESSNDKIINL